MKQCIYDGKAICCFARELRDQDNNLANRIDKLRSERDFLMNEVGVRNSQIEKLARLLTERDHRIWQLDPEAR